MFHQLECFGRMMQNAPALTRACIQLGWAAYHVVDYVSIDSVKLQLLKTEPTQALP